MSVIDEGVLTQTSFKQSAFPDVAAVESPNENFLLFQSTVSTHSEIFQEQMKEIHVSLSILIYF